MSEPSPVALKDIQRLFLDFVRRPLDDNYELKTLPQKGRFSTKVLHGLVKPNDRLSSEERLELYARQYWFRVIDSLHEDYPGVRALGGDKIFNRLLEDYLQRFPSRSYTLRNLGSRFPDYLARRKDLQTPKGRAMTEMARLEWAKLDVFDAAELPPLDPAVMQQKIQSGDTTLRIGLQPHIRLLKLEYPVDEWLIRLNREEWRAEASNAVDASGPRKRRISKSKPALRKKTVYTVVHRHDELVYFKRQEPEAYCLLLRLQKQARFSSVLSSALRGSTHSAAWWQLHFQTWFCDWSALGWLVAATPNPTPHTYEK